MISSVQITSPMSRSVHILNIEYYEITNYEGLEEFWAFSLAFVWPCRRSLYENEPAARSRALVCGVTAIQERPHPSPSHLRKTAGSDGEFISTSWEVVPGPLSRLGKWMGRLWPENCLCLICHTISVIPFNWGLWQHWGFFCATLHLLLK